MATTDHATTDLDFSVASDLELKIIAQGAMDFLGNDWPGTDADAEMCAETLIEAAVAEQARREGITLEDARARIWV